MDLLWKIRKSGFIKNFGKDVMNVEKKVRRRRLEIFNKRNASNKYQERNILRRNMAFINISKMREYC